MSDHDVFMNLIFLGLVYGVGYWIWFVRRGDSGDSIEDYLERHPKTLRHGRVHCYRCGSGSIYLRPVGSGGRTVINAHICRQCGTKLYKSVTRLD